MLVKSPILLPWRKVLLENSKGEIQRLVQNGTVILVVWAVHKLDCRRREFQRKLPTLSAGQEDKILSWHGENRLADILERKLIYFLVMSMKSLTISLIDINKDSNIGLLIIIDQQFLLS